MASTRKAVFTPKILMHICLHIQTDSPSDGGPTGFMLSQKLGNDSRATLARVARVCKDFCDPALRVLWRDIPSFAVLVMLLSAAVKVPMFDHYQSYMLRGNIAPEDWAHFEYYARLVRRCRLTSNYHTLGYVPDVDATVYPHLHLRNGHRPLLPHIETLEWCQTAHTDTTLLCLLAPSLRRLTIFMLEDAPAAPPGGKRARKYAPPPRAAYAVHALLDALVPACPDLEHLALRGDFLAFVEVLPPSLVRSRRLRSLDLAACGQLNTLLARQLGLLPALETLCISTARHMRIETDLGKCALRAGVSGGYPWPETLVVDGKQVDPEEFSEVYLGGS